MQTKRIGYKMAQLVTFVAANPGVVMLHAAEAVGPNGSRRYGYAIVHRCIDAGLVVAAPGNRNAILLTVV